MGVGVERILVVCLPAEVGQGPCPAGTAPAAVQGYVIAPAQAANIEAQNQPFDYGVASAIWGFAFTFVVGLYLVSKSAGTILNAIRNL